jgi:hypothetical protein
MTTLHIIAAPFTDTLDPAARTPAHPRVHATETAAGKRAHA